jgi:hypothetical protein
MGGSECVPETPPMYDGFLSLVYPSLRSKLANIFRDTSHSFLNFLSLVTSYGTFSASPPPSLLL